jgi:hypothetical protein
MFIATGGDRHLAKMQAIYVNSCRLVFQLNEPKAGIGSTQRTSRLRTYYAV